VLWVFFVSFFNFFKKRFPWPLAVYVGGEEYVASQLLVHNIGTGTSHRAAARSGLRPALSLSPHALSTSQMPGFFCPSPDEHFTSFNPVPHRSRAHPRQKAMTICVTWKLSAHFKSSARNAHLVSSYEEFPRSWLTPMGRGN